MLLVFNQIGDIIRPNLVWLAGDRARTLRTAGKREDGTDGVATSSPSSVACRWWAHPTPVRP